jgi:type I restriction enzyme M protein
LPVIVLRRDRSFRPKPQGRWRPNGYDQLAERDKLSLDIFSLKYDSLEDSANLEDPGVVAAEIMKDYRAALEEFELVLGDLSS